MTLRTQIGLSSFDRKEEWVYSILVAPPARMLAYGSILWLPLGFTTKVFRRSRARGDRRLKGAIVVSVHLMSV